MRLRWLTCLFLVGSMCGLRSLGAAEPYLEFVEGLRNRDLHEYAILYLEQLEKRSNVPPEIKTVIPFEKGITLIEGVRGVRRPEDQTRQLDLARKYLEEFLKKNPKHALAPQANTELAQVLIGKGRVEVLQSRSPSNAGTKSEFQAKARKYFGEARKVFQAAHDQYKAEWEKYGVFIDQVKERQEYEAREKAALNYIQAQLNLAIVTYEEAQTYDAGSKPFLATLEKAAGQFEAIHSKYRSQLAGLYARMWQGKCFEEQRDIVKALGIYNELLQHPGKSPSLRKLKDRVLHFRLICLNSEERHDYQVVVQEAVEWLRGAPKGTRVSLGIQWEMARALESLASQPDVNETDKNRYLAQALSTAQGVNRSAGEYKEPSTAMIQRVSLKLNRDPSDPKDFATAYEVSRGRVREAGKLSQKVSEAKPKDKAKVQEELDAQLKETARLLNLALVLASPNDQVNDINQARYWLSYVYYLMKDRSYEAAILSEYIANRYQKAESELPLDAAYLSMAAYLQAYRTAPKDQREADIARILKICNLITTNWPNSDKANDARMNLGSLYSQIKQPDNAARVFSEIPSSSARYLDAQLAAGQAYWQSYVDQAVLPDDQRPPQKQLDTLQKKAQQVLRTAVDKLEAGLAKDAPPVDNITAAKLTLVQILNGSGAYKESLALLTTGPRCLTVAVTVPKEDARPKQGVKSRPFASAVYQELLRSYVGTQQLDKARASMKDLEKIEGAGGGGAAVTQIYLRLGQELEKEVKRLQAAKDPRLGDVLKSFETFLDDMFNRKEGRNYNTLVWVGETYYHLGEGVQEGDKARSNTYFTKGAQAFQEILDAAANDSSFTPAGATAGVRLRLTDTKRRQGDFEEAEKLVRGILTERPNALDAQTLAAQIYQDWAARGGPEDWEKWNLAISGDLTAKKGKKKVVWGWYGLSDRLGRNLLQSENPNPDYEKQYLEARYNVAYCRFHAAQGQSQAQKRQDLLDAAKRDIVYTATVSSELGGGETWERFNLLYREILEAAGQPVVDLQKRISVDPTEVARVEASGKKASKPKAKAKAKPAAKAESSGSGELLIVLVLVVAAAGGGGYFYMQTQQKKQKQKIAAVTQSPPRKKRPPTAKAKT